MKPVLALLLLAACGTATLPPPTEPPQRDDTCMASRYTALVGQDATALERVLIVGMVRLIRPDTAVTMDFRPERLNFAIDAGNTIADVYCG